MHKFIKAVGRMLQNFHLAKPGNGLEDPVPLFDVGVEGVELSGTIGTTGLTSAASLVNGGLVKAGSGPQKSAVGAGGDCVTPPGVFLNGPDPCFLGCEPAPRLEEGIGEPGLKLSSGRSKSMSGIGSSVSASGAENKGPVPEPKILELAKGFWGLSDSKGGSGAEAAFLFNIGSLRTLRRAFFSLCADLSAFRAAAVVTATWGVTAALRLR